MVTNTPNYSLKKPTVGGDDNAWGTHLNSNADTLDSLLKSFDNRIASIEAKYKIPVGGLYFSLTDNNPSGTLGYGTWTAFAAGRTVVGVGTTDGVTWSANDYKGQANVTLSASQIPSHSHWITQYSGTFSSTAKRIYGAINNMLVRYTAWADSSMYMSGMYNVAEDGGGTQIKGVKVVLDDTHSHSTTVTFDGKSTDAAGGDGSHTNIQPSVCVYIWRRTS